MIDIVYFDGLGDERIIKVADEFGADILDYDDCEVVRCYKVWILMVSGTAASTLFVRESLPPFIIFIEPAKLFKGKLTVAVKKFDRNFAAYVDRLDEYCDRIRKMIPELIKELAQIVYEGRHDHIKGALGDEAWDALMQRVSLMGPGYIISQNLDCFNTRPNKVGYFIKEIIVDFSGENIYGICDGMHLNLDELRKCLTCTCDKLEWM